MLAFASMATAIRNRARMAHEGRVKPAHETLTKQRARAEPPASVSAILGSVAIPRRAAAGVILCIHGVRLGKEALRLEP